jgi:hypothetical protein
MESLRKSTERSLKELSTTGMKLPGESNDLPGWPKTPDRVGTSKIENLQKSKSPLRTDQPEDRNKLRNLELKITRFLMDAEERRRNTLRPVGDPFE